MANAKQNFIPQKNTCNLHVSFTVCDTYTTASSTLWLCHLKMKNHQNFKVVILYLVQMRILKWFVCQLFVRYQCEIKISSRYIHR